MVEVGLTLDEAEPQINLDVQDRRVETSTNLKEEFSFDTALCLTNTQTRDENLRI